MIKVWWKRTVLLVVSSLFLFMPVQSRADIASTLSSALGTVTSAANCTPLTPGDTANWKAVSSISNIILSPINSAQSTISSKANSMASSATPIALTLAGVLALSYFLWGILDSFAFVWLTVQSPGSINGPVREDLIDNIKTTILMYNNKVESHREFYKKNFGLNDTQINRVGRLRPRLEYMFVQDNFTRVVQTVFTPEVLNYLRSEKHLQTVFNRHKATERTNPNWLDDYLAEAATMKRVDYDREPESDETVDAQAA